MTPKDIPALAVVALCALALLAEPWRGALTVCAFACAALDLYVDREWWFGRSG